MNKQEVLKRLCKLCSLVAENKFEWHLSADCFCGGNHLTDPTGFLFDEKIVAFMEDAITKALELEKTQP